jgi:DNA mismatch endonuclease, patch repair protein
MPTRRKSDRMPRFQGLAPRSATTSRVGAANRRKNTNPEILLRKLLSSAGVRYRLHPKNVPGHPDLVIRRSRIVVFCDGDFWHGRRWAQRKIKLARGWNAEYWIAKIERNRKRDRQVTRRLSLLGWRVIRVWESEIQRNPKDIANTILDAIKRTSAV